MGERHKAVKRSVKPQKCEWCGQVKVGSAWIPERRQGADRTVASGFCPRCRAVNFMDFSAQRETSEG